MRLTSLASLMSLALGAGTLPTGVLSAQDPRTATIQLPVGHAVTGSMLVDINGDDRTDLVLACHNPKTGIRSLRTYLRQAKRGTAFASAPSQRPLNIDPDVVAFTFVDCTNAPGRELILLTPELVVAVVGDKDGANDGDFVGSFVGESVGDSVGETLGDFVGSFVGESVGRSVGDLDGVVVG